MVFFIFLYFIIFFEGYSKLLQIQHITLRLYLFLLLFNCRPPTPNSLSFIKYVLILCRVWIYDRWLVVVMEIIIIMIIFIRHSTKLIKLKLDGIKFIIVSFFLLFFGYGVSKFIFNFLFICTLFLTIIILHINIYYNFFNWIIFFIFVVFFLYSCYSHIYWIIVSIFAWKTFFIERFTTADSI